MQVRLSRRNIPKYINIEQVTILLDASAAWSVRVRASCGTD